MEAVLSRRSWVVVAPIACGCLLASAAAYVAVSDPLSGNSTFLPCPLHQTTGLWCPACGLTRATHALLNGDVPAALGYNLLAPLFLGVIIVSWLTWMRVAVGRPPIRLLASMSPQVAVALAALVVSFGVLRNVPGFQALAP